MAQNPIDPEVVNKVKQFAVKVNEQYPLKKTIIFGSQAKGKATPTSDIDVCLVSESFQPDLSAIRHQLAKLSEQYDDRIEVHPMLPEDFNNRYYTFAQEIKNSGVVI